MSNVEQYVALREQGMTYAMIAKKYGVTRQAIQDSISHHKNRITYIKPSNHFQVNRQRGETNEYRSYVLVQGYGLGNTASIL